MAGMGEMVHGVRFSTSRRLFGIIRLPQRTQEYHKEYGYVRQIWSLFIFVVDMDA